LAADGKHLSSRISGQCFVDDIRVVGDDRNWARALRTAHSDGRRCRACKCRGDGRPGGLSNGDSLDSAIECQRRRSRQHGGNGQSRVHVHLVTVTGDTKATGNEVNNNILNWPLILVLIVVAFSASKTASPRFFSDRRC
jgi:hypothetical protein